MNKLLELQPFPLLWSEVPHNLRVGNSTAAKRVTATGLHTPGQIECLLHLEGDGHWRGCPQANLKARNCCQLRTKYFTSIIFMQDIATKKHQQVQVQKRANATIVRSLRREVNGFVWLWSLGNAFITAVSCHGLLKVKLWLFWALAT